MLYFYKTWSNGFFRDIIQYMNTNNQEKWMVVGYAVTGRGVDRPKPYFVGTLTECVAYQIAQGIKFVTRLIRF